MWKKDWKVFLNKLTHPTFILSPHPIVIFKTQDKIALISLIRPAMEVPIDLISPFQPICVGPLLPHGFFSVFQHYISSQS